MFGRLSKKSILVLAMILALTGMVLYACAQVQEKPAPQTAVKPAPPPSDLSAPPPGIDPGEDLTTIPQPGPPFAKQNRNPDLVLKDLPLDASGVVDWVKAIDEKHITPKHSLDPKASAMPPFPLDVEIPAIGAMPNVIFPHRPHTLWLECGNCHPGIFTMKKGSNPISMVKIVNGEFCGRCHGRVAFPISNCGRCHVKPKS